MRKRCIGIILLLVVVVSLLGCRGEKEFISHTDEVPSSAEAFETVSGRLDVFDINRINEAENVKSIKVKIYETGEEGSLSVLKEDELTLPDKKTIPLYLQTISEGGLISIKMAGQSVIVPDLEFIDDYGYGGLILVDNGPQDIKGEIPLFALRSSDERLIELGAKEDFFDGEKLQRENIKYLITFTLMEDAKKANIHKS